MNVETFKYDNRIVRAFSVATVIWAIVGMSAGLLAAIQLFWPEANLNLQFTSKDGSSFAVKAKVAHSRRTPGSVGPVAYLSGLEFADKQTAASHEAVTILLEKVNWILSFYDENREVPTSASRRRAATNGRVEQP